MVVVCCGANMESAQGALQGRTSASDRFLWHVSLMLRTPSDDCSCGKGGSDELTMMDTLQINVLAFE